MDVFGSVLSTVGALAGGYGALRSWRTDKKMRGLERAWTVDHFQNQAWLLRNVSSRPLLDVRIDAPAGVGVSVKEGRSSRVAPGDSLKILVFASLGAAGDLYIVRWKTSVLKRSKSESVFIAART